MNNDIENLFSSWAKPLSQTDQERCENAEKAIRNSIKASDDLKDRNIKIFTHGSYRNNTNVRKDSDVDIGILCFDAFYYNLPEGYTKEDFDITPASYDFPQFKTEVGEALTSYFGASSVERGNKAFKIHENSYHVDADVAPFFEHRRYFKSGRYLSGVELLPDNGGKIINWPEQHYENGVGKNTKTNRRFKALVRIIKSLCNRMSDEGIDSAQSIPGFLNECLVWNVPTNSFGYSTYTSAVRACLTFLFNNTMTDEKCHEWGEVSELKYLFRLSQKWTRQQAHEFISDGWDYLGFK